MKASRVLLASCVSLLGSLLVVAEVQCHGPFYQCERSRSGGGPTRAPKRNRELDPLRCVQCQGVVPASRPWEGSANNTMGLQPCLGVRTETMKTCPSTQNSCARLSLLMTVDDVTFMSIIMKDCMEGSKSINDVMGMQQVKRFVENTTKVWSRSTKGQMRKDVLSYMCQEDFCNSDDDKVWYDEYPSGSSIRKNPSSASLTLADVFTLVLTLTVSYNVCFGFEYVNQA